MRTGGNSSTHKQPRKNKDKSSCELSTTNNAEPMQAYPFKDKENSVYVLLATNGGGSGQAQPRGGKVGFDCTGSRTGRGESIVTTPTTNKTGPELNKPLTDNVENMLACPKHKEPPMRTTLRTERSEPMVVKSQTESTLPGQTIERTKSKDPSCP